MTLVVVFIYIVHQVDAVSKICPISTTHLCVCINNIIDCDDHGFAVIPSFTPARYHFLVLSHNNITTIGGTAFASLNVSSIDLSYNMIATIDDRAFGGIESFLEVLNLAHNKLTTLHPALSTLSVLKSLDVTWNPIAASTSSSSSHGHHASSVGGLNSDVMRLIGDTIDIFKFGSTEMKEWPDTLLHLNQLKELTVAGLDLYYWPPGSFHGFEQTLRRLIIDDVNMGAVPVGIAALSHLEELHLNNLGGSFTDDSLISLPFAQLAGSLRILSLTNDGLTYFPEGIKDLLSLESLILDGNRLEFVSDEAIQLLKDSRITILSLRNCNLKRVPGAISDLSVLRELDLSENIIRSIESTDLQNLTNLQTLKLSNNPLKYISDNSLCGLNSLEVSETKLND